MSLKQLFSKYIFLIVFVCGVFGGTYFIISNPTLLIEQEYEYNCGNGSTYKNLNEEEHSKIKAICEAQKPTTNFLNDEYHNLSINI
jgi:hypothetical protein